MIRSILPGVFESIKTYGAESIEVEFKLGKVSRRRFDAILTRVSSDTRFRRLGVCTERNEINGTDARRVIIGDDTFTMYKKKLMSVPLAEGTKLDVSLERRGEPDVSKPYRIFRDKHRTSFTVHDVWRLDLTQVRTNDPRFADSDEPLYEVELELLLVHDLMYYYTLEHALGIGTTVFEEIRST